MIGPSGTIRANFIRSKPVTVGLTDVPANTEGGAQFHPVSFIVAPGSWRVRENAPLWTYGKAAFNNNKPQAGAPLVNWFVRTGHEALSRSRQRGPVRI